MNNAIKINKFVIFSIVLLFGIIIGKLIYVSVCTNIDGINIKKFALSRTTEKRVLAAARGSIYDCDGVALAENVNSYTVIAYLSPKRTTDVNNPKHVVDKEATAKALNEVLGIDYDEALKLLNQDNKYQTEFGAKGKGISELEKEKLEKLNLPGIDFIKESKRYYPSGAFASYIIGYAKKNEEGNIVGEMGLESYFDDELSGTDGYYEYQKDAYGYQIANSKVRAIEKKAENGENIYLTIDSNMQMYLENAIKDLTTDYSTDWTIAIVADAKTGAIKAAATNPTFDPNKLNIVNYNNPLVAYTYEPGSTMKIFSFMSSIEEGLYNGDELYQSGTIQVDNYTIKDWNNVGWGKISFDTGFTYSSNVAATLLAQKLGREKLKDYYTDLGFGQKTNIELFGELNGKVNFFYNSELASVSYGQGMTVTPIQMIQALTVLTNNGTMLKPYIVDKIVDQDGNITYESKRTEIKKIYSESTITKMIELLDKTVNGEDSIATGKVYQTDKVRLIGKTGTAQYTLSDGSYTSSDVKNIRSFAGIFPKENPEYIIYIVIKDLNGASRVIGNMTKNVVDSISKYKNLSERESNKDVNKFTNLKSYLNKDITNSINELSTLGLNPIQIGNGTTIVDQFPKKDNTIVVGSKVYLKTNSDIKIMVDITNWNKSEIITLLNFMNVDYEFVGNGNKALSFNIPPGEEIKEKVIIYTEETTE